MEKNSRTFRNVHIDVNLLMQALSKDKKKEYAIKVLKDNLIGDNQWSNIASSNDLVQHKESIEGLINANFDGIGTSDALKGALKGLEIGNTSTIIETFNTACIVKIIDKLELDQNDFNNSYEGIKSQLTSRKTTSGYSNWLNDMKASINIEDYRSKSY